MRIIIFMLFAVSGFSQTGIRDFQIVSDSPFDSIFVMINDTNSASPTYKYGSWTQLRPLLENYVSGGSDADWYKTATTIAPTNAETAFRTGTTIIGADGTYTGLLSVTGRIDQRFPGASLNNVMIGRSAGNTSMTGDNNVGVGYETLQNITSGASNMAFGYAALNSNTSGEDNVGIGATSLVLNTSGHRNVAIGSGAGFLNVTGIRNTFIGFNAGFSSVGDRNVFIGHESGRLETGTDLLFIENTNSATPLVWGDFANDLVKINGKLGYTIEGGTATTLAGRDASEYFSNVAIGAGLDLSSGTLENTGVLVESQQITLTGSNPYVLDLDNDVTDVTFAGAGIITLSESVANTLTITGTEVDGSVTNEAWTVDADDAATEVISSQTLKFEGGAGIVTDYISGTPDKVTFIIDGDEFATETTPEADDYILFHDENGAGADALQKILYSDIYDLIIAEAGADGNGIYSGDGTTPSDVDVTITDNINFGGLLYLDDFFGEVGIGTVTPDFMLDIEGTTANLMINDTDGSNGNQLILRSDVSLDGVAEFGGISFQYTDAGTSDAWDIEGHRRQDAATNSTLEIRANHNTAATTFIAEKNVNFSANTTESHISMNAGMAYTQNYEWTGTASDLTLDRSYYNVFVTGSGALEDEINLPNVFSSLDNWTNTMTATDCQVGQEYVITNFRAATNLVVRTNSGDFIDGAATTTISLTPFQSVIIKCVRLNGTTGYWMSYD